MNFVKASIFNFTASAVLYLLHIATSIIQARVLGPTELGRFQLFVSTQTIVVSLFSLGLGQAGIYFRNNKKIELTRIVTTLLKAEGIIVFVVFNVLFFLVYLSHNYFGMVPNSIIFFYAIGASASLAATSMRPLLIADMNVVKLQMTNYITALLSFIALVVIFLVKGSLSVNILIILVSITNVLGLLLLLFFFFPHINFHVSFEWSLFKSISLFGIKMSLNNIAFLCIQNAPIYMISWLSINAYSDIGLYTRATAVCALALFINSTLGPLFYSKLSSLNDDQKKEYSILISSALLLVNIVMTLIVFIFGSYILYILYGIEYVSAKTVLRILSLTILLSGTNELINSLLSSIGKPEYLFKNFLITIVFLIPFLYLFINRWELIGCAVAVVLATIFKTMLLINDVSKFIPLSYKDFFTIKKDSINSLLMIIINNIKNK